MLPLWRDAGFTFRFADDRIIPRFHLDGVAPGVRVVLYRLKSSSDVRQEPFATAITGADGWVDLETPLIVRAGEGFIAVPDA